MPSKFCLNCYCWEEVATKVTGDTFGICHNVAVKDKVAVDGKAHVLEEGTLWTEEYFGCLYWRENDGSLFGIDKYVKK